MENIFLAVKTSDDTLRRLVIGVDIFRRPMPWKVWFAAINRAEHNVWRFVRVSGLKGDLNDYIIFQEEDEVTFGEQRFALERASLLTIVIWGLEAVYYKTALKFWEWPCCQQWWARLKQMGR